MSGLSIDFLQSEETRSLSNRLRDLSFRIESLAMSHLRESRLVRSSFLPPPTPLILSLNEKVVDIKEDILIHITTSHTTPTLSKSRRNESGATKMTCTFTV